MRFAGFVSPANLSTPRWRDVAASGGYWIASASNKIYADANTLTGSIGVIFHLSDLSGLMKKIGVTPETIISGKFKDIGSPDRPLRPDERALLQRWSTTCMEDSSGRSRMAATCPSTRSRRSRMAGFHRQPGLESEARRRNRRPAGDRDGGGERRWNQGRTRHRGIRPKDFPGGACWPATATTPPAPLRKAIGKEANRQLARFARRA